MSWITGEDAGLTKEQIERICEALWKDELSGLRETCHDCGVSIGEVHAHNCDVARCLTCGGQLLSCDCVGYNPDTWDGLWPYTKYCYDHKLICKLGVEGQYTWDYNTAAIQNFKK